MADASSSAVRSCAEGGWEPSLAERSCVEGVRGLGEGVKLSASGCRVLPITVGLLVLSSPLAAPARSRCIPAGSSLKSPAAWVRVGLLRAVAAAMWTVLLLSTVSPFRATEVAAAEDLLSDFTSAAVAECPRVNPAASGTSARLLSSCATGGVRSAWPPAA